MRYSTIDGKTNDATGREMYRLADTYAADLGTLARMPLADFVQHVAALPYRIDAQDYGSDDERVMRPAYILRDARRGIDCKKKAILVGAWAKQAGVPYRFVAVSERPDRRIHHVMTQVRHGGRWINADATLPGDRLDGAKPGITYAQELLR